MEQVSWISGQKSHLQKILWGDHNGGKTMNILTWLYHTNIHPHVTLRFILICVNGPDMFAKMNAKHVLKMETFCMSLPSFHKVKMPVFWGCYHTIYNSSQSSRLAEAKKVLHKTQISYKIHVDIHPYWETAFILEEYY